MHAVFSRFYLFQIVFNWLYLLTYNWRVILFVQEELPMTWLEQFENDIKTPAIGTPEWFKCIPSVQVETARQLVANRMPVVVQRQSDTDCPALLVLFDGTEFVAGGFDDETDAQRFM